MNHSDHSPKVVLVGAGKMGLPLACELACNGAEVVAVDINAQLVEQINRAEAPFDEPLLQEKLTQAVSGGALRASTNLAAEVPGADVIIVIVPVLLDENRNAELSIILSVTRTIAGSISNGALLIYETTLPVGTSRQFFQEISASTGKVFGRDVFGAFSPERVKSRHVFRNLSAVPKIVGGYSPLDAQKAEDFYQRFLKTHVINLGSLEAAELAKLADMVYRDVNIALANELSRYAEAVGVDFYDVRKAANTSGEAHLLLPGIGVGGHCTPVYPYFLINHAQVLGCPQGLAERGRTVNDGQAEHAVDVIRQLAGELTGKQALILGLAFRPEVKEAAYSSAFLIAQELEKRGATVHLHDPYFSQQEVEAHGFRFCASVAKSACSILILNTAHAAYQDLYWPELAKSGVQYVIDGRNALNSEAIRAENIDYYSVGRPVIQQRP